MKIVFMFLVWCVLGVVQGQNVTFLELNGLDNTLQHAVDAAIVLLKFNGTYASTFPNSLGNNYIIPEDCPANPFPTVTAGSQLSQILSTGEVRRGDISTSPNKYSSEVYAFDAKIWATIGQVYGFNLTVRVINYTFISDALKALQNNDVDVVGPAFNLYGSFNSLAAPLSFVPSCIVVDPLAYFAVVNTSNITSFSSISNGNPRIIAFSSQDQAVLSGFLPTATVTVLTNLNSAVNSLGSTADVIYATPAYFDANGVNTTNLTFFPAGWDQPSVYFFRQNSAVSTTLARTNVFVGFTHVVNLDGITN